MGALDTLLKDPQDLRIKHIYHSRMSEAFIRSEPTCEARCRDFYHTLDHTSVPVTDIKEPGQVFDFDDMHLKILSVASAVTEHLCYNNASMIMRVWDKKKTMVFLADAYVDCGNKALEGPYADDLNCEYLQMAHHGQQGAARRSSTIPSASEPASGLPHYGFGTTTREGIQHGATQNHPDTRMDERERHHRAPRHLHRRTLRLD